MSIPVENWGQLKISPVKSEQNGENGHPMTDAIVRLVSLPKGKERADPSFVSRPLVSVPVSSIASASGTTKNDISIVLRPNTSTTKVGSESVTMDLTSLRFAVPNICVGYEQSEEAGREILATLQGEIKKQTQQFLQSHKDGNDDGKLLLLASMGSAHGTHENEKVIGIFDDITLSYPSGKYKMVLSNYHVVLEDKKKSATGGLISFPLSDIQQLYLCDVPAYFSKVGDDDAPLAQYVVLILKTPIKIRTTAYPHVVISCPSDLVLDEEHAWKSEVQTQEEINQLLGLTQPSDDAPYPLVPTMSGKVSEILIRTFKALAKVPAYGGLNKEYRTVLTQQRQSCMRCLFRGGEGILYVVNGGFLFLHRPATKIAFTDITEVSMDESESGNATFQLTVYANGLKGVEKLMFSGIDKAEKEGLLQYLAKRVKLIRRGLEDDSDMDDDDEESEELDESDESDGDDGDSASDGGSASDSDGNSRLRKRHRGDHKEKKHKKDKKHRKEKKHRKDKEHRKEKKHRHTAE